MRIQEERHQGESWLIWKLGNLLSVDEDYTKGYGLAFGFKENSKWNFIPRFTKDDSLFYNAILFFRLVTLFGFIPVGFFFGFRWSGSTTKKAYLQSGIGIKGNGRFAILFRVQSDPSAATGYNAPNYGQSIGWEFGTK